MFIKNIIMAVNGSDFLGNPWDTIFSPFVGLLGAGFYLVPISFIAAALYLRTNNIVTVSVFIWVSTLLLTTGSIFADYPEMAKVYFILTAIGFTSTILGLIFMRE